MRISLVILTVGALFVTPELVLADPSVADPSTPTPNDTDAERRWCASEFMTLPGEVCVFTPSEPSAGPRTLIIHLHGVIQPDTTSQWTQQRVAARAGAAYGFTVIMPRGRRGIGPTSMPHWWAWPTSIDTRAKYEKALIAEWMTAKNALEQKAGAPFDRTYIFGFSNGAYYATSLAMRGRVDADGYALFAGGSGAPYHEYEGKKTKNRVPIAVAWGAGDPSHDKQEDLVKLLRRMHWPSISLGHAHAGHAMTDIQVAEAVGYLGAKR